MIRVNLPALIVSAAVSFAAIPASHAQSVPEQAAPLASRVAAMPVSDLLQAAEDLRQAAEAFDRFGGSLQSVSGDFGGTMERTAKHLAGITSGFDPLGLQAAFQTIQQQQRRIERLQRQQTGRLRKEIKQLRQELQQLRNSPADTAAG